MLFFNIIYSVLLYALFGVIHSVLASEIVKKRLLLWLGDKIAFYRLGYNIISISAIYFIWDLLPDLTMVVYDLPYPYDLAVFVVQMLGLAGFLWAGKYFCLKEFLGISQIERWLTGIYDMSQLDENLTFRTEGPYKFSRHPVYFFCIVMLLARPFMDLQYLIFSICTAIYFYIGTYFEEKKLLNKFGNDYLDYSSKVARIIPYKIIRGKSE
ncbi:MAG: isoprenylcysteine carboxylmethyltransferase family protein [Rhodothermaceae bacterium]